MSSFISFALVKKSTAREKRKKKINVPHVSDVGKIMVDKLRVILTATKKLMIIMVNTKNIQDIIQHLFIWITPLASCFSSMIFFSIYSEEFIHLMQSYWDKNPPTNMFVANWS